MAGGERRVWQKEEHDLIYLGIYYAHGSKEIGCSRFKRWSNYQPVGILTDVGYPPCRARRLLPLVGSLSP